MGILALLLSLQTAGNVYNMGTTADRLVVMEAEGAGALVSSGTHAWTLVNASTAAPNTAPAGFVGTGAMACLPNSGSGNDNATGFVNGARMNFRVLFREAGTYHVWVRGRAYDHTAETPSQPVGNNDSCHVGLNGVASNTGYRVSGFNATEWRWTRTREGGTATIVAPSVGVHTFSVYMREDGLMVDRVLITANANYGGVTQNGTMNGPAASGQIPDETVVDAPALTVTPGSFRFDVSWSAVTNADTYLLERSQGGGGTWTQVFSGPGLSYGEENFDTANDYCFRVRGVNDVFGQGPVSTASCARAQLPPPRTKDHDEGLLGDNCACGASAGRTVSAAWLLLLLPLAFRRR